MPPLRKPGQLYDLNAYESVHSVMTECSGEKDTNPKDVIRSNKLPLHLWPLPAAALDSLALLDGGLKYDRLHRQTTSVRVSIYVDAYQRHLDTRLEG